MGDWLTLAAAAAAAGISTATVRRRLPGLPRGSVRHVSHGEAFGLGLSVGRKGGLLLRADALTARAPATTATTGTPATCNLSATSTRGVWPVVAELPGPDNGALRVSERGGQERRLLSVTRLVLLPDGSRGWLRSVRRQVILSPAELPDLVRLLREHGDPPKAPVRVERLRDNGCVGLVRTWPRHGVRVDVLDDAGRCMVSLGECRKRAIRRKGHVACVVMPAWAAAAVADLLDAGLQRTQTIV